MKSVSDLQYDHDKELLDFQNLWQYLQDVPKTSQKHRDVIFDTQLYSIDKYLETVSWKINKTVDLICKFENLLSRSALITLHKGLFVPTLIMVIFFMIKPTIIASSEIRACSIQCLFSYYWSNAWFIKRETITGTRFWKNTPAKGNYAVSQKSLITNVHVVYSTQFQKGALLTLPWTTLKEFFLSIYYYRME